MTGKAFIIFPGFPGAVGALPVVVDYSPNRTSCWL